MCLVRLISSDETDINRLLRWNYRGEAGRLDRRAKSVAHINPRFPQVFATELELVRIFALASICRRDCRLDCRSDKIVAVCCLPYVHSEFGPRRGSAAEGGLKDNSIEWYVRVVISHIKSSLTYSSLCHRHVSIISHPSRHLTTTTTHTYARFAPLPTRPSPPQSHLRYLTS